MLLPWLLQFTAKRRPLRSHGAQAVEPNACKPQCDTMLGEVYYAHAKIHGPNQLLPVDVLPAGRNVSRPVQTKAAAKPACGRHAVVY